MSNNRNSGDQYDYPSLAAVKTYQLCVSLLKKRLLEIGISVDHFRGNGPKITFFKIVNEIIQRLESTDNHAQEKEVDIVVDVLQNAGLEIKPSEQTGSDRLDDAVEQAVNIIEIESQSIKRPSQVYSADDLSPNQVKSAIINVINEIREEFKNDKKFENNERVDYEVREILKRALAISRQKNNFAKRINVVQSNFDRLNGYLNELIEDGSYHIERYGVGIRLETAKIWIYA